MCERQRSNFRTCSESPSTILEAGARQDISSPVSSLDVVWWGEMWRHRGPLECFEFPGETNPFARVTLAPLHRSENEAERKVEPRKRCTASQPASAPACGGCFWIWCRQLLGELVTCVKSRCHDCGPQYPQYNYSSIQVVWSHDVTTVDYNIYSTAIVVYRLYIVRYITQPTCSSAV